MGRYVGSVLGVRLAASGLAYVDLVWPHAVNRTEDVL